MQCSTTITWISYRPAKKAHCVHVVVWHQCHLLSCLRSHDGRVINISDYGTKNRKGIEIFLLRPCIGPRKIPIVKRCLN
jgi:hypothetical protein